VEVAVSTTHLILPYAVEDVNRKKPFLESMEAAALLCVAESERKKSGILGRTEEALTIFCKLHYPLWAIPFEDDSLLVDGMGYISSNIVYSEPPDIEAFIEHLKRHSSVQELYHSALKSHVNTFSRFVSQKKLQIGEIITNKDMLTDFNNFIQDGDFNNTKSSNLEENLLIPPKIDEEKASKIVHKIEEHIQKLQGEIKGLHLAIETVGEEAKKHTQRLQEERRQIQKEYETKLSKTQTEVDTKKAELENEWNGKIEKIAEAHKKEIEARLTERKKWEQELLSWEQRKSEYEKRKDLRKIKGDDVGVARWNVRLQNAQDQISTAKKKIKTLSDFIAKSEKETQRTREKLREVYTTQLEAEDEKIKDLIKLKEEEINKKQKETDELSGETTAIITKIKRMIKRKQESIEKIRNTTLLWRTRTPTLIHLPFYLVFYDSEGKGRCQIHLPTLARGEEGITMKLRKTFRRRSLQSKISNLLKPRSKTLEKMLGSFIENAQKESETYRLLRKLGEPKNLLTDERFKATVRLGMKELEKEGWIKSEETKLILETYIRNGTTQ
jgi:hypothetical protein